MKFKKMLKAFKNKISLIKVYRYDYLRMYKNASYNYRLQDLNQIRARLTYYYHAIEKGLSNPNVRLGFGKQALKGLENSLNAYKKFGYSKDDIRFITAISVVQKYISYHEENNYDVTDIKTRFGLFFEPENTQTDIGGYKIISNKDIENNRLKGFKEIANERVSTRTFSGEKVDVELIHEAIEISMKTPSICNRQPWKVYIYQNKERIKNILGYQKGFNGYVEDLNMLLMVTVDKNYLLANNERNQDYVAGGMFCMSLLYSLEYVGLGACALNGSLSINNEKLLRNYININDSESLTMFIAVGNFQSEFKVPVSYRDTFEEITVLEDEMKSLQL